MDVIPECHKARLEETREFSHNDYTYTDSFLRKEPILGTITMNVRQIMKALLLLSLAMFHITAAAQPASVMQALGKGWANFDMRLRHEGVEQLNSLEDATGLTLRTRLTYRTGKYKNFFGLFEFEDSRQVIDDFSVPATGFNPGMYSTIADPENTGVDQAYIQYGKSNMKITVGRQRIAHDSHRFVGDVGWRQDRQTFDAATLKYSVSKDIQVNYSYVQKRNRIFAEEADVASLDHLFNASMKTNMGKLVGYAYMLELDDDTVNALDTYGVSFHGTTRLDSLGKLSYGGEYATQESTTSGEFSAVYMMAEASAVINKMTAKVMYEVLGSDLGAYGFATPLATLHKFNGWADTFLITPDQGLVDISGSLSGRFQKGRWTAAYHIFSADEPTDTIDDFGTEINVQYIYDFDKNASVGVKYADYAAGDPATGKVDTTKVWVWGQMRF